MAATTNGMVHPSSRSFNQNGRQVLYIEVLQYLSVRHLQLSTLAQPLGVKEYHMIMYSWFLGSNFC